MAPLSLQNEDDFILEKDGSCRTAGSRHPPCLVRHSLFMVGDPSTRCRARILCPARLSSPVDPLEAVLTHRS